MPAWLTIPEVIKIVLLVVGVLTWGFNLENRVSLAEQAMEQETLGYRYLQEQASNRLDKFQERIETRLERIEQILMKQSHQ